VIGEPGPLREAERDAAVAVLGYCFPDEPRFAERAQSASLDRAFAVRHNRDLASVVLWRDTEVTHHGLPLPIAIAGPGGTHPAHRRRGHLAGAQEAFLGLMRDAGCVVSGLETPITRWHRRNGWDVASAVRRYSGPPQVFRLHDIGPIHGSPDFQPDPATAHEMRQLATGRRFGALPPTSDPPTPADLRNDTVTWHEDGKTTGLLRYAHRQRDDGVGIVVHELHATSPRAYAGMLTLLAEHNNIRHITWNAPTDDPLQQLVVEPRDLEPIVCSDKMLRVVDLARLRLPRLADVDPAGLILRVEDPQAPWNTGRWEIVADSDVYRFAPATASRPDAALQVGVDVLGPLVSGYLPARAAALTGQLSGAAEAVAMLDRIRSGWQAPYCPDTW
jgi:predicted acetyltransferase